MNFSFLIIDRQLVEYAVVPMTYFLELRSS